MDYFLVFFSPAIFASPAVVTAYCGLRIPPLSGKDDGRSAKL
jgi:hypothetical protein